MIEYFKIVVITSIWCIGVMIVSADGMILDGLRIKAKKRIDEGKFIYEALIYCPWCLPSIHSVVGYFFCIILGVIKEFEWKLIFIYPLVAMAASLITGIIWGIHNLISSMMKYFINAEKIKYMDISDRKREYKKTHHESKSNK